MVAIAPHDTLNSFGRRANEVGLDTSFSPPITELYGPEENKKYRNTIVPAPLGIGPNAKKIPPHHLNHRDSRPKYLGSLGSHNNKDSEALIRKKVVLIYNDTKYTLPSSTSILKVPVQHLSRNSTSIQGDGKLSWRAYFILEHIPWRPFDGMNSDQNFAMMLSNRARAAGAILRCHTPYERILSMARMSLMTIEKRKGQRGVKCHTRSQEALAVEYSYSDTAPHPAPFEFASYR